jgi:hypothetical protein
MYCILISLAVVNRGNSLLAAYGLLLHCCGACNIPVAGSWVCEYVFWCAAAAVAMGCCVLIFCLAAIMSQSNVDAVTGAIMTLIQVSLSAVMMVLAV